MAAVVAVVTAAFPVPTIPVAVAAAAAMARELGMFAVPPFPVVLPGLVAAVMLAVPAVIAAVMARPVAMVVPPMSVTNVVSPVSHHVTHGGTGDERQRCVVGVGTGGHGQGESGCEQAGAQQGRCAFLHVLPPPDVGAIRLGAGP